jgi:alpha-L-fucosidase
MSQLDGFTASKYDPEQWADLFERAGARYAVMTTKHHDGVALWDTQANDLSVVKKTPAKRDLVTPYVEALRRHNLKVGFYFSHLDWSHPDYATVRPHADSVERSEEGMSNRLSYPEKGKEDPARWAAFLKFHRQQLKELCTGFGKVDLLWFDGEWERDAKQYDMKGLRDQLLEWQPGCVFNSRLLEYGDYATPEQGLPTVPPEGPWEFCVTVNDSWGYQVQDHNHKSVRQIVRLFCECLGGGGNLLLDVGPYENGTLQPEQIDRLEGLGRWTKKHSEAIYGTRRGLPPGLFYGPSSFSQDRRTLFLYFFDRPIDQLAVKGIRSKVARASVVGSDRTLPVHVTGGLGVTPGVTWIDFPDSEVDPDATVVKLEFEEPADVYYGAGRM